LIYLYLLVFLCGHVYVSDVPMWFNPKLVELFILLFESDSLDRDRLKNSIFQISINFAFLINHVADEFVGF